MHTRFTSLVSGLTLSLLLVTPVLAQSPVDQNDEQDAVISCRDAHVPTYRTALDEAVDGLRGSLTEEWKHQVEFRLHAAKPARRSAADRALQGAGVQLVKAFDRFVQAQHDSVDKDVSIVVDSYIRLDGQEEDAALSRWSDLDVSFQALNASLARAERTLRLYASPQDRLALSRVWKKVRTATEASFVEERDAARQSFVKDMDECIGGGSNDNAVDEPATEPVAEKKLDEKANKKVNAEAPIGFQVIKVSVDTTSDYTSVCTQKVTVRARIYAQGTGRTIGYFLYLNGARSAEIVADTDASGGAYVQDQHEFISEGSGFFNSGSAIFIVTSPNDIKSNVARFDVKCQNYQAPSSEKSPNVTNDAKADARLVVDGKAEVNACGMYRYNFTGTISYGGAGTVKYYWLRSDGGISATQTLTFEGPGTKIVSHAWDLGGTYSGWVRLMIVHPNTTQAQADFTLIRSCETAPAPEPPPAPPEKPPAPPAKEPPPAPAPGGLRINASVVSKEEVSLCGGYTFRFQGNIRTENAAKITYRWERSDGATSPTQDLAAEKDGTYTVTDSWYLEGGYAGWVRLHILSPVDIISNQAVLKLTQMCK